MSPNGTRPGKGSAVPGAGTGWIASQASAPDPPRNRTRVTASILVPALFLILAGCDGATGPGKSPLTVSARNTMAIRTAGGTNFTRVIDATASFGYLLDEDEGDHVVISQSGQGGDLIVSLNLPGGPEVGTVILGEPDPLEPSSSFSPPGRIPFLTVLASSVSAGVTTEGGHYQSLGGGTVEIESVTVPERGSTIPGEIRGRVSTRAAGSRIVTDAGGTTTVRPDTIDVDIAFWADLGGRPYGVATAAFTGGALHGTTIPRMFGVAMEYEGRSIISLRAESIKFPRTYLVLTATSNLVGPGVAELDPLDDDDPLGTGIAGEINGTSPAGSLTHRAPFGGSLVIETWEPPTSTHFGEATGTLAVTFEADPPGGEITTGTVTFRIPVSK